MNSQTAVRCKGSSSGKKYTQCSTGGAGKLQPTLAKRDPARGDTIVSLLYAAAAGDLDTLKTHHLLRHNMNAR